MEALWQAVLGEIEVTISRGNFMTWFKNTRLLERDDKRVVIGVPNVFTKRQLEDKYLELVQETLKKNSVAADKVDFKVIDIAPTVVKAPPAQQTDWSVRPQRKLSATNLNEKYTFDNFVVGSSNEVAYAAAQAIAKDPGKKYNPLFIYGGVGLGKTHLIQAIGNEVVSNFPDTHIAYITSEQFASEFVASILRKKKFGEKYRQADVLIIDDMQFIAGKEKTEEEFFHTFNDLHQANKQIIISSDKPPKSIPTVEERLKSRFEWGMTIDIQPPDFETRLAIIHSKAQTLGAKIPREVSEYLATHIQSNVRELEGALTKILAHSEVTGATLDIESVEKIFGNIQSRRGRLTDKNIVEKTARYFNISSDELVGPRREKTITEPRQVAMYLMRQELHLSYPAIAKAVGRKDHTTAIHSVDKIETAIMKDSALRQAVYEIKERLYV